MPHCTPVSFIISNCTSSGEHNQNIVFKCLWNELPFEGHEAEGSPQLNVGWKLSAFVWSRCGSLAVSLGASGRSLIQTGIQCSPLLCRIGFETVQALTNPIDFGLLA